MTSTLARTRVALLVGDGVDLASLEALRLALIRVGSLPVVVAPSDEPVAAWSPEGPVRRIPVAQRVAAVDPGSLDALVVPAGVLGADALRGDARSVILTRAVAELRRPVATLGHAGWMLVEAGLAERVEVTGHPTIRLDLENAGGRWRGDSVVRDGLIVTARGGTTGDVEPREVVRALRDARAARAASVMGVAEHGSAVAQERLAVG